MNQSPEPAPEPEYPQDPRAPQYPHSPQSPQHPDSPQYPQGPPPAYPQQQAPPPYPASGPPAPGHPQPEQYPQPPYPQPPYPQPPRPGPHQQYPQQPPYPQAPHHQSPYQQAPYPQTPYPQTPHQQTPPPQALYQQPPPPQAPHQQAPYQQPAHPQQPSPQQPAYPQYQQAPTPTRHPAEPPTPARPPAGHPAGPPAPLDDLDYQNAPGTRLHLKAHQRSTDATAFGQLALHVPGFLMSLMVVLLLATLLEALSGLPYWVPTLLWIASGALVFHRPSEDFFARRLLRLQRPLPHELAALAPVWREVTARAGVDGERYELWIEDSDHLNAYAAAGHIVAVTRYALDKLPRSQLAAVLAHELGHHTGGHAWSGLLGWWYSLPGRVAWQVIRAVTVFVIRFTSFFSYLAAGLLIIFVGMFTLLTITATYGLPLLLLVMPYFMAAVGRRAELRADAHAAVLGFAPMLAQMLHGVMVQEEQAKQAVLAQTGKPFTEPGTLSRLLSTHPDHRTRLHHLQPYMQPGR
ncbi:M48 family metalloprotease [Streptomyces sp. NBC_01408]|uniref:M48 family metalloprotease n=1 Tax=Streptomyces sp. NBC_01408 TaxID=2903855 RepID=UPI00225B35A1|nr:M48 family metalloprotease [Streptomyces sp. NBC_01408]MCX4691590.1 M48 family metalloprotease [Streptomyces sp. NBC_01408]